MAYAGAPDCRPPLCVVCVRAQRDALSSTESPFMGSCFLPNDEAVARAASKLEALSEEEVRAPPLLCLTCSPPALA